MFLASGKLEENNLSDYLTVQASLVAADKLYVMKKQVQTLTTYACRSHDSKRWLGVMAHCICGSAHIVV
jgi:Holliday junction resolvase